ncbi:MAG: NeuD/PglB/VioB family sugar acetyltransferase [Burkholderiales bacterium]|nr:NeuD/PglB/VioB family sugar acetyltransferase [Burkholderiales bacterium]
MRVIFGASGFAREVYIILTRLFAKDVSIECFVCADQEIANVGKIRGIPVISESDFFARYKKEEIEAYVAVGAPSLKQKIVKKIKAWNPATAFPSLIDPYAVVDIEGGTVLVKDGAIICSGAVVTTDVVVGEFSLIYTNCTVGHDTRIGAFSTLSPGVNISGNVEIGECVFFGTGSVAIERITVASGAVIGAGAVVVSNISELGVYIGIPAKQKESR